MTISQLINAGLCALGNVLGTEISKGCITQITAAKSIWLLKPGEMFRAGETFAAEFERLIKAGSLIVLNNVNTFEESGNDDTTETLDDDTMFVTNEGKYKFDATFTNGMYFNKALHSLKGFRRWNTLIVTTQGIFGKKDAEGNLSGFTTGMIQPSKLVIGSNSQGQKEGLMFQFTERADLDSDYGFIQDTTARKQKGVTQVTLSFVNVPSDTDTTVTIKAHLAQDQNEAFTGEDFNDFLITTDGVTDNPTAGDDSATSGTYVLTKSAVSTGEVLTAQLYDNGSNTAVIKGEDGDYYKSNTITVTAVA